MPSNSTLVTVIVSVYKNIEALERIFEYLEKQTYRNFEVIVAEDNDSPLMKTCVVKAQQRGYFFFIRHVFQADDGFRKCKILNQAIKAAQGEGIIFLDGDCLPHREWVRAYRQSFAEKKALVGRRVLLNPSFTKKVLTENKVISLFNLFRYGCKRIEEAIYLPFINRLVQHKRGIWGCNWGILKVHLLQINGFDEDYTAAGIGEDTDIEWRLRQQGIALFSMKYKALTYHLHHAENYSTTAGNEQIFEAKKRENNAVCLNGIARLPKPDDAPKKNI